jgi:hypothetical protein
VLDLATLAASATIVDTLPPASTLTAGQSLYADLVRDSYAKGKPQRLGPIPLITVDGQNVPDMPAVTRATNAIRNGARGAGLSATIRTTVTSDGVEIYFLGRARAARTP